ncbi:MAG: hypothetical protein ACM65L_00290 [Microcoleus sp.]
MAPSRLNHSDTTGIDINGGREARATRDGASLKGDREHPDFVRAKHDRRQFISDNQRFTAVMLRPYEYICKTQMHPGLRAIAF